MNSDKELVSSWRRMRDRQSTCNKGQFKSWQQAAGIDFSIYVLLMSDSLDSQNMLRPISGYVFFGFTEHASTNFWLCAWLHAWPAFKWSHGMGGILGHFNCVWEWPPTNLGKTCWFPQVVGPARLQEQPECAQVVWQQACGKLKASAGEILELCRPLAYYLQTCALKFGICTLEITCFLSWLAVLEFCIAIPALQHPQPSVLQNLVEKALSDMVSAGWGSEFRPKMHWALHYSDALAIHKMLPSCFSLESKHKSIRNMPITFVILLPMRNHS